jgi:hypothetical protein
MKAVLQEQLEGMLARPLFSCQEKKGCGMMYQYYNDSSF